MMQLGKAIREGLARQAAAPRVEHPDAGLLTSFLEQTLPQAERQQVLQHLSLCGDCREVVALSLPEMESVPLAVAQPETSIWKRWLVVRWAATAAAVLLIAGTVTVYRSGNQPHQLAAIVDGPDAVANRAARQAQPAEAPAAKGDVAAARNDVVATTKSEVRPEAAKKSEAKHEAAPPSLMASAAPAPLAKAKTIDEIRKDQLNADLAKAVQSPMAPSPSETLSQPNLSSPAKVATLERPMQVSGAMPAAAGNASPFPPGSGRALRDSNEPVLQTYNQPDGVFTVQKEQPKPSIMFGGRPRSDSFASAATFRRQENSLFSHPMPSLSQRWQVTPDGQLKRSHAIGEDFHPVHVADGIFFKSVAENGSEVWAGGIGGALYHSTDDGKSWMKVMPSAGDQALIADVTAIRATGHGAAELETSNSERWITVDGGQHWRKSN